MRLLTLFLRRLLSLLWALFAWLTIVTAVLLISLRLLLPLAAHYKNEIIQAVSQALDRPIRVASLKPEWRGFGPVIVFKDMQLLDRQGAHSLLHFKEARVGVDLLQSLVHGRLEDSHLTVTGVNITLVRHKDGRLGVEGFGSMSTGGAQGKANLDMVQQWLEDQQRIRIADSDIEWIDERRPDEPLHFAQVDLELRNESPSRHVLSGSAVLPSSLGHTLNLVVSFDGALLDVGRWRGDLYVDGSGYNLTRLLGRRNLGGIAVGDGVADVKAWGKVGGGRLLDMQGQLQVQGLVLERAAAAAPGAAPPSSGGNAAAELRMTDVSGRFDWRSIDQGWILDVDKFWIARGNDVTPPTQFRIFTRHEGDETEVEGQFAFLRLEDVAAVLGLSDILQPNQREVIAALQPHGELHHAYMHVTRVRGVAPQPYFYVQFTDLGTRAPWHKVPAVSGLDGVLEGTPEAGDLKLDSRGITVAAGEVFRNDLAVDRLTGRIDWRRDVGGWRASAHKLVVENPDITADARFVVTGGPERPRPYLDLVADFGNGNVAHAARYLPAGEMHPHAVAWLDRALVNGRLSSGAILVHGNLADFPFDHHQGNFEVRFDVDNGILDYDKEWPRIEDLQAGVVFSGRSLEVEASQGKILDSTVTRARARIADLSLRPSTLTVDGEASGPTSDALRLATETPLNGKIGKYLKHTAVDGDSRLTLSLVIPLAKTHRQQVDGTLVFQDSSLSLGDKISLAHINGPLKFTRKGLQADGITASVMGYPATIDAGTVDTDDTHTTYFEGRGETDVAHVKQLKFLHLPFIDHAAGRTNWQARLLLSESLPGRKTHASLQIDSGLQGMSLDLPAPLAKAARDKVPLLIKVDDLGGTSTPVFFNYGGRLSGAFVTRDGDAGREIERGEFRFNGGDAVLPNRDGIFISGAVDHFALAHWRRYFSTASGGRGAGGLLDRLAGLDVHVKTLQARDWEFHDVSLQASKHADDWSAKIKSTELAGTFELPGDDGAARKFDLDYLHIRPEILHGKAHHTDPADIPPLRLTCKEFSYDGKDFGNLRLSLSREPGGVHIDQFSVDSPTINASVIGDWTGRGAAQITSVAASIDSKNIGDTLSKFGYVGTIKGGSGSGRLSATWSGSPADIDLKTLDGSLALDMAKGRLLEVDPGAGRILGILSLQALPRRLTLDFSDLFEKGFSFDSIKGDFAIHGGNAYTDNMVMEGPAARVDVTGRVGLVKQDYDQTVTVTPHLTGSLPLAGVIASGVGVGVAILLLQKIFENQIDAMTRVKYTVTGPWTKPVVERLGKDNKPTVGAKS